MAIDRHDNNSPAADGEPARADAGEHPARDFTRPMTGDRPVPDERRSRGELYSDLRDSSATADQGPRSGPDGPRTTDNGAWEWKGLRLTPEHNYAVDAEILARRNAEGRDLDGNYGQDGITPAMRRIEDRLDHGQLVPDTEKFALKSDERFKEKLAKLILQEPDKPASEHAREIHDGIRYTFLFEKDHYSDGVAHAHGELLSMGFELLVLKNTWDSEEYKGVNTRWLAPAANLPFEVQFHTPDSWTAKQQTHDAYEKINDLRTPAEIRERLRAYQAEISNQLEVPAGSQTISNYRKEGW